MNVGDLQSLHSHCYGDTQASAWSAAFVMGPGKQRRPCELFATD